MLLFYNSSVFTPGDRLLRGEEDAFGNYHLTLAACKIEKHFQVVYFKQKFAESFQYRAIGSWWEPKDRQNEITFIRKKLKGMIATIGT